VTTLTETVDALRGLLAGRSVDYAGSVVHTSGYRSTLPPSRASITVLGFGADLIEEAIGRADRIAVPLASAEHAARLHARLVRSAERYERPRPRLAVLVPTLVDPDQVGEEQLRRALLPYLRASGFARIFTEAGFGEVVALARTGAHPRSLYPEMTDEMVRTVAAVGSVAQVRAALAEYRAVGVDELVLMPITAGDPCGLHTLTVLADAERPLAGSVPNSPSAPVGTATGATAHAAGEAVGERVAPVIGLPTAHTGPGDGQVATPRP
jgi:probable F420-dependent oxidoreductase